MGEGTPTARPAAQERGAKVISVSLEQDLLTRSDALAKRLDISRALLIEQGFKAVLAAEGRVG